MQGAAVIRNLFKVKIVLIVLLTTWLLVGEDSLTTLSFSDLMNVSVSVASKRDESIFDAPGFISSYRFTDLENLGYYTLKEIAAITPGFSVSSLYGECGFETRGVKTSPFNNNRHLVLWDGIPINHARANKAPISEELSLFGTRQVEFLRGPASALYGTGAYYGVINIKPLEMSQKGTLIRSRIGFGGPTSSRRSEMALSHRGDEVSTYASVSYYQQEASKALAGTSGSPNYRVWDDTKALSFQGAFSLITGPMKGLGAGSFYLKRSSGLGEHWNGGFSHEMNDIRWETFITYLRYKRNLTDLLHIDTYFKHNRSTETGWFTPLSEEDFLNFSSGGELMYSYEAPILNSSYYFEFDYSRDTWGIIGGLELDWKFQADDENGTAFYIISADSGQPYLVEENAVIRSDDFLQSSLFLQGRGEVPLLKGMLLTGGVRLDVWKAGENSFEQLSPRLAVVQRLSDFLSLKVLYGTALLAPGVKEVMLNDEVIHNSPLIANQLEDLEAETFSTFEGGLHWHDKFKSEKYVMTLNAEVTGFSNRSLNEIKSITFEADSSGTLKTENAFKNTNDTITAYGVECALEIESDLGLGLKTNYSYAKAVDQLQRHPTDIPFHKVNGAITYRNENIGLYSAFIGRYVKEFYQDNDIYMAGYSVADVNLGWISPVGVGAELHVTNLLDREKLLPVGTTPLLPLKGRSFQLTLTARF